MKEEQVVCLKCLKSFRAKYKSTFLGFKKYICPHCEAKVLYDLRSSYRALYWILSVVLLLSAIAIIARGDIPLPGLLGVAAVWGLIGDRRRRKEIEIARSRAPTDTSSSI